MNKGLLKYSRRYLLVFFIGLNLFGFGQIYYNDAQLWFNLYLEKKISKKLDIHLNQQDRWTNNITQYGLGYADVGITIKFTKNIKLLADYVFAKKIKYNETYLTLHQYYLALVIKKDVRRLRFMYRNMFQVQYVNPYTSKSGYIPRIYDRNKLTIKYEATKRFSYYVAGEVNVIVNNPNITGLTRSRLFVGTFFNTTKHQQLELYFLWQQQLQTTYWFKQNDNFTWAPLVRKFVYGIGYSINF